jgi:hypothetical protein
MFAGTLSGLWRASEVYVMRVLDVWPRRTITLSIPPGYADATANSQAQFAASVTSPYPSTSFAWEKSVDDGVTWATVQGATSSTLSVVSQTIANDGDLYRIIATAGLRTVRSSAATLRFDTVQIDIFSPPQSQTTSSGQAAFFYVSVGVMGVTYFGIYSPTYQWQSRASGASQWSNMAGQTSDSITVQSTPQLSGTQYRVIVSVGSHSSTSTPATLTVT